MFTCGPALFLPAASAPAGLTYVGGTSGTGTNAAYDVSLTGLTGGIASAPAAGDLVIVVTGDSGGASTDTTPGVNTSGYTELTELYSADTYSANLSVNWKIMGGSPDTVVNVTGSNHSARSAATSVHVWRGAHQTTPIDVTTTTATGANNGNIDSPSITPVTSGAVVLTVGLNASNTSSPSAAAPSGYGNAVVATSDPGEGAAAVIASKAWTSGAENPGAWTGLNNNTQSSWCAATVALRPAA